MSLDFDLLAQLSALALAVAVLKVEIAHLRNDIKTLFHRVEFLERRQMRPRRYMIEQDNGEDE